MSLSETVAGIIVMHVPGYDVVRDQNVRDLEREFMLTDLPAFDVAKDPSRQGILLNYRQALAKASALFENPNAPDWVIIMQDDAVPLRNWEIELEEALIHAPRPIVSLCHFARNGQVLADRGFAYAVHTHAVWGQAVAYHRSILGGLKQVADDVAEMDYERYRKWDDGLAAVFNILSGSQSCFTARAIFDHLNVRSTVGNVPGVHRHPHCTIETTESPGWGAPWKQQGHAVKPMILDLAKELTQWRSREKVTVIL